MDKIVHLIMWIFIGALVVLIVTHAAGFSTAVTAVGGQVTNDASLLAGYAPNAPASGSAAKSNTGGTTFGAAGQTASFT
jgi:hypothetical protein